VSLTDIERRVLGHVPVWAEDEAWHVENEGGPRRFDEETQRWVGSIRFYSLPDFTARLAEDRATQHPERGGPLTEAECLQVLEHLAGRGFVEPVAELPGAFRMTQAGFDEITGPEKAPEQLPGPVQVEVHPAVAQSEAPTA
jgi:hypothetical protein